VISCCCILCWFRILYLWVGIGMVISFWSAWLKNMLVVYYISLGVLDAAVGVLFMRLG